MQSQRGGAPALSNFGVLPHLWLHPLTQNAYVLQGNRCGEAQPRLPSQESRVPALPNVWGTVLLYLCLHPLIQNDQIRHANTYEKERVFRSPMPLHFDKCVARFVSDSWVCCCVSVGPFHLKGTFWAPACNIIVMRSSRRRSPYALCSAVRPFAPHRLTSRYSKRLQCWIMVELTECSRR